MTITLQAPDIRELKPHITVFGVGGAGGNAVNNMIESGLEGVGFVVANTDAQALTLSKAERIIQMGVQVTEGLGAGSQPEVGRAAAEEVIDEIRDQLAGAHMAFITAGMGGGTGTGAAPVVARVAREMGILTVGVVTKPFQFEGVRRMRMAEAGISELQQSVDTLIVIPNQNLFRVANEKTTFADAFAMADQVLYSGVACITDLMVKEGLINLDFADVRSIMRGMGKAMMGTGEATGEHRANRAAEAAIANPLLDDVSMRGARGLLISITGGNDLTLYEVDEAATRIREEVDQEANIILGATFDETLEGVIRVSVVATGIDHDVIEANRPQELADTEQRIAEVAERLRAEARARIAAAAAPVFSPAAIVSLPATPSTPVVQLPPAPVYHPAPVYEAPIATAAQETGGVAQVEHTAEPDAAPSEELSSAAEENEQRDAFIPPQAERVVLRPTRMPRVEDLPIPAQNQLRAVRRPQEGPKVSPPEQKRVGLLQRLASVGLGRREETEQETDVTVSKPVVLKARPPAPSLAPADYARRPASTRKVSRGSEPAASEANARLAEEDLEIPAFLRRQAN